MNGSNLSCKENAPSSESGEGSSFIRELNGSNLNTQITHFVLLGKLIRRAAHQFKDNRIVWIIFLYYLKQNYQGNTNHMRNDALIITHQWERRKCGCFMPASWGPRLASQWSHPSINSSVQGSLKHFSFAYICTKTCAKVRPCTKTQKIYRTPSTDHIAPNRKSLSYIHPNCTYCTLIRWQKTKTTYLQHQGVVYANYHLNILPCQSSTTLKDNRQSHACIWYSKTNRYTELDASLLVVSWCRKKQAIMGTNYQLPMWLITTGN